MEGGVELNEGLANRFGRVGGGGVYGRRWFEAILRENLDLGRPDHERGSDLVCNRVIFLRCMTCALAAAAARRLCHCVGCCRRE